MKLNSDALLASFATLAVIDTVLMVTFWQLEGNPLLLMLGPVWASVAKLAPLAALVIVWRYTQMDNHWVGRTSVTGLVVLYALVTLTNLWVLA